MKVLIIGAGLYGSVCAFELTKAGHSCHVVERRDHVGGNVYTRYIPEAACHEHVYGAHIFHTNSCKIWEYICQFSEFNSYTHRLKAVNDGMLYSFPINLMTIYQISGAKTPTEARQWLGSERRPVASPQNMEEYCLSEIGHTLYALFIEGYTTKQWGKHPRQLPADIVKRLPVRLTFDDNYFSDRYQGIPVGGYTSIIEKMLEGSSVELGTDYLHRRTLYDGKFDLTIYTGPIDAYFGYEHGILEYRSLRFDRQLIGLNDYQGNAVINYTDAVTPWTRIIEHKHFDRNFNGTSTLITHEFPADWRPGDEPYYPINDIRNTALHKQYLSIPTSTHFGGRLGEYRYYDMHQVIGAALTFCERLKR